MKCVVCRQSVFQEQAGYVCEYCSLVLPEELVIFAKRPIVAHFEEEQ